MVFILDFLAMQAKMMDVHQRIFLTQWYFCVALISLDVWDLRFLRVALKKYALLNTWFIP